MTVVAAVMLSALAACRSADPPASLQAVADGDGTLAAVTIAFQEEHPREWTVAVEVDGGGRVTATRSALRPGCDEVWEEHCWHRTRTTRTLDPQEHRTLVRWLAEAGLESLPSQPAFPSAPQVQVRIRVAPAPAVEAALRADAVAAHPALAGARARLLALAR